MIRKRSLLGKGARLSNMRYEASVRATELCEQFH